MNPRLRVRVLVALGVALLAGCEADEGTGAAAIAPRAVVHAVLDPLAPEQVILVERSRLDARELPPDVPPDDIILAYGGDPIRGARVVLYDANGDSAVAVEDAARRPDGVGAGVYRVATRDVEGAAAGLPTISVRTGVAYRLRVETPLGVVRGATVVPDVSIRASETVAHDVSQGYGRMLDGPSVEAAAHVVSISSDAFRATVFDQRPQVWLDRDIVRASAPYARREFPVSTCEAPTVSMSAADPNYAAYARARDRDNLHGDDLRTAGVSGGSGVFGAVVPYARYEIAAYSTATSALDGRWHASGTTSEDALHEVSMCLHATHPADPGGVAGMWELRPGGPTDFVFGGIDPFSERVALTFITANADIPPMRYDATLRADTLDGRDTWTGRRVRFVRDAASSSVVKR